MDILKKISLMQFLSEPKIFGKLLNILAMSIRLSWSNIFCLEEKKWLVSIYLDDGEKVSLCQWSSGALLGLSNLKKKFLKNYKK